MSDAARRLAQTRLAIIEEIDRREHRGDPRGPRDGREGSRAQAGEHAAGDRRERDGSPRRARPSGWFGSARHALGTWWRHHPAHMAVELATPALGAYAEKRPFTLLGIAAVVGAVVVVTRPWRLISVTGLLVAVAKSSQLSGLLMSALSAADFQKDERPYE
jgi:hypothetical protein